MTRLEIRIQELKGQMPAGPQQIIQDPAAPQQAAALQQVIQEASGQMPAAPHQVVQAAAAPPRIAPAPAQHQPVAQDRPLLYGTSEGTHETEYSLKLSEYARLYERELKLKQESNKAIEDYIEAKRARLQSEVKLNQLLRSLNQ